MKLWIDMDGVLTDFLAQLAPHGFTTMNDWSDDRLWALVKSLPGFWENMPWMEDGKQLWEFIKKYQPTLLTAPAHSDPNCKPGKLAWIRRELGDVPVVFSRASEKMKYADADSILIDDLDKNVNAWRAAGGIAILHKSAADTIEQLRKLNLTESIITEGINDKYLFKCLFMGGGGGSGKGTILRGIVGQDVFGLQHDKEFAMSALGVKVVNSDIYFEKLLKRQISTQREPSTDKSVADWGTFKEPLPQKMAPADSPLGQEQQRLRIQSGEYMKKHFRQMIDGMLPIVIDLTAKSVDKLKQKKEIIESYGYDTALMMISVSLETALARNEKRGREGGRMVEPKVIEDMWRQIDANKQAGFYQELFGKDYSEVNNEDKPEEERKKFLIDVRKQGLAFFTSPLQNPIGIQRLNDLRKDPRLKDLRDLGVDTSAIMGTD